jgi:Restriction alleviation protein Lar
MTAPTTEAQPELIAVELKGCPFCGAAPRTCEQVNRYVIHCPGPCVANVSVASGDKSTAINYWNTRKP